MNVVRSFVNYAIFRELCDRMRFEVDCAKSHHRVISEGLNSSACCHRGTNGVVKKGVEKHIDKIPGKINITELQKIALLGSSHILRKVLSIE